MGTHFQHDSVDVTAASVVDIPGKRNTVLSKAARFLAIILFGLPVCLLVTLLFLFGTALHLNHESMIFDIYNYLIWTGSLILAVLVALVIFRA